MSEEKEIIAVETKIKARKGFAFCNTMSEVVVEIFALLNLRPCP